ncbi:MAG: ParB/RepB/Spo0J family partition protein [Saprospiraceae bacterium]
MAKAKKKELGLGIRALLSNIDDQETTTPKAEVVKELSHSVAMVPLTQIEVNPFQPRTEFDQEALEELAASLKVHGLIQPITLRRLGKDKYQLISGERRFRASGIAGLEEVPAYIRLADDQEMLEMALVENIQRQDLNAVEIAITYQRLLDECKLTHESLSERVGKKRSSVTNYLRLLKLPPEIQEAVREGSMSMGHARALAGIEQLPLQLLLFKKALNDKWSVRELEKQIQLYSLSKKPSTSPSKELPGDYKDVEDRFRKVFGIKKLQLKLKGDGKGQLIIPFSSTNELNRLLDVAEGEE